MKQNIRVIVADDHSVIRVCVAYLLAAEPHMSLVGTAIDAPSLAALFESRPCDVIVADLGMPGFDGENNAVTMLGRLMRHPACPPVVILTMLRHPPVLNALLLLGAAAIVDKRDTVEALIHAIEAAVRHRRYLSRHVELRTRRSARPRHVGVLSAREWEVFGYCVRGFTVSQIAERLRRSTKTISMQKRSALRKLGLETGTDLIDYARQIGLV
ncbi:response regulator [Paraburkholderia sp.]|uniref:response regulator n=1 Tax=Paraburkholderia sp. TaxID=1926495 RepID=UPI003D6F3D96